MERDRDPYKPSFWSKDSRHGLRLRNGFVRLLNKYCFEAGVKKSELARRSLIGLRWEGGLICPKCGRGDVIHRHKTREGWRCVRCFKYLTLTNGTALAGMQLGYGKLIRAVYALANLPESRIDRLSFEAVANAGVAGTRLSPETNLRLRNDLLPIVDEWRNTDRKCRDPMRSFESLMRRILQDAPRKTSGRKRPLKHSG